MSGEGREPYLVTLCVGPRNGQQPGVAGTDLERAKPRVVASHTRQAAQPTGRRAFGR